jgi:hypothetical protein
MLARILLAFALLISPALAVADDESPFYVEFLLSDYRGDNGYLSQEAYAEYAFGENGLALWGNGYHDEWGHTLTGGIAKSFDNGLTLALGAGRSRFDGEASTVLSTWLGYSSESWEVYLSAERTQGSDDPWYYQGAAQHYVGDHLAGVYGETGFGVGPAVTWTFSEFLALRVAIPIIDRGDTNVLATLIVTM